MIKRLLQLITDRLGHWQSDRDARRRSQQVVSQRLSPPQPTATQSPDRITYTLSRSEAVTALNRTLRHGTNTLTPENEQPDLITSLADSAYLCECQGRFGEAEGFYQQAVTLSIRHFGETHLEVATHLSELAKFYYAQQRYTEAQPLLEQTLNIRQPYQDSDYPNHPLDHGETLHQLANIYRHLEQYTKAEALYQQALSTFRQALGPDHARTEAVYSDLMKMLTKVIASGQFETMVAELPPLDLETLGDTYSWAKPEWMTQKAPSESYSWIKLKPLSEGQQAKEPEP